MPTVAIVCDVDTPNGKSLAPLFSELEAYVVGNDLGTFQGSALLDRVEVLVFVVFAGGKLSLVEELWALCPKLKWVHSLAAGVETLVPVLNGLPRGPETPLTNAKGAFSRSLAEYALAAMLYFNKQLGRLEGNKRAKRSWQDRFTMAELHGKTVGFLGFGDIAQTTAVVCKPFGLRVLALRNSRGAPGADLADEVLYMEDGPDQKMRVFRDSDFIVCSLPGGPATKHFCGAAEFAAMRPTGVFISMGRGTCVDEAALHRALTEKVLAGAALDVFEVEPLPQTSPLWECENLLLSPHNADLTEDYMPLAWAGFTKRLAAFSSPDFSGFDSVVDKTKGY